MQAAILASGSTRFDGSRLATLQEEEEEEESYTR
jgi:hypothetical protein